MHVYHGMYVEVKAAILIVGSLPPLEIEPRLPTDPLPCALVFHLLTSR